MARYAIETPDGRYEVEAPDTMSQDDVLAHARQQLGYQAEPEEPKDQDWALSRGWNKMIQSVGITGALASGDAESGAQRIAEAERYRQANPGTPEGNELMAAWQRGEGISGGIEGIAGEFKKDWRDAPSTLQAIRSTGANLAAMGSGVVEQVPNMLLPMGGMLAGGAAGSPAGPVGVAGGAWAGASAGNTLVEGGGMAQEALRKAGIDPLDTEAVKSYLEKNGDTLLTQAGIKGAVIGAVDTATMGIAGKLLTGPAKAATGRALVDMGVDVTDKAAVNAAIKSPELAARVAVDPLYKAATTGAQGAARNVAAAALEPAGEFTGEFLGQGLATGEYDTKEAFLEAASSIGQSGATFAGQKAYTALKYPFRAGGVDVAPTGGDAAPTAADILGAPEQSPVLTESEKALYTPKSITALDRAAELEQRMNEVQAAADSGDQDAANQWNALRAERDAITADWPKAMPGAQTSFTTEAGARLDGQYALIEAGDLTTSHDENLRPVQTYPSELQPRERDRHASEMQIQQIVHRLDPARLGESADVATGAPIVGADGLVESGNARVIAMKRVYQANGQTALDYKQFLKDNADRFGIAPSSVDAMQKPVLVRVRSTPVNRAEFARQANQSTVARMSPSEQARSDAAQIDSLDDLNPTETGEFSSGSSAPFVRRFMAKLPATEQAGLIDSTGQLSQAGYQRIRNAVLAKAYGDSPVLQRMVESLDSNVRNVGTALLRVAPQVAKTREAINEGALHDADLTPDLLAAVEELSRLKDKGTSVAEALAQSGMFGDKLSPEARDLLAMLDENIRSPRRIAEFVQAYTDALMAAGNPNQGTMFGDTAAPAKIDLIAAARRMTNGQSEAADTAGNAETDKDSGSQPEDASRDQGGAQSNDGNKGEEWLTFPPETGTLGIPRAEMPQIKGEHRGALIQFLQGRGISHETVEMPASQLKPTQAEFSTKKVQGWKNVREGSDRSVLASSDGYILDGHHQWVAALATGETEKVIRFDAPIQELLSAAREFPGANRTGDAPPKSRTEIRREIIEQQWNEALSDLGAILRDYTHVARMVPEDTPNLMPTLVKLFEAGFGKVGMRAADLMKYVQAELRKIPEFKTIWNKIPTHLYRKAADKALANHQAAPQQDLFGPKIERAMQDDLFAQPAAKVGAGKTAMIDGRPYDGARDNFVPPHIKTFLSKEVIAEAEDYVEKYYKNKVDPDIGEPDRARAEALLKPLLKKAGEVKAEYDQKIIDITKKSGAIGQMIAPPKSLARAIPKLVIEEDFNVGGMKDALRSTIVVASYADAQGVLDEIVKNFELTRKPKNRTGDTQITYNGEVIQPEDPAKYGGYSDLMVNVRMPNGVIAEIQINVPEMLAAKEGPGRQAPGHKLYEAYRDAPKESPLGHEILRAMLGYYAAAYAAASARSASASLRKSDSDLSNHSLSGPRGPNLGRGSSDSPSLESANHAPSGNSTKNPPSDLSPNRQPAGNLSGTFIASTSTQSISQGGENVYTGNVKESIGGANEQPGQVGASGTQGQSAEPAQGVGGKRQTARVRKGKNGGNQFSDDLFGDGNGAELRIQQDGRSDGARQDNERRDADGQGEGAGRGTGISAGDGGRGRVSERAGRRLSTPAGRDIPPKSGQNYRFGDEDLTYEGGWLKKATQNVEAVELAKKLETEDRQATREEQSILAKFIGWGASEIRNAIFDKKTEQAAQRIQEWNRAKEVLAEKGQLEYSDRDYYTAYQAIAGLNLPGFRYRDTITPALLNKAKPDASLAKWVDLRARLKAILTPEEWDTAERSTQYAHYTSKAVVQSMWKAVERMGFKGGTILEPGAGIGVFPGLMSPAMANNSVYTGIEFDALTGQILKQLFPDERIAIESFVESALPDNFYDIAIGNPPFANVKVLSDPAYKKHAFSLHDYFFAKSIDKVKPGGLMVYVTSRYTMDKQDSKARKYLAERADLVGAIRLPQTAFMKNAGTEVVTDVLFLRKRMGDEARRRTSAGLYLMKTGDRQEVVGEPILHLSDWTAVQEIQTDKGPALINEYFANHQEMVLGTHSLEGSMYSKNEYTVLPKKDTDIEAQFAAAVENLPTDIFQPVRGSAAEAAKVREIDYNPKAKKEGNYYLTDAGVLMQREGGLGVRADGGKPEKTVAMLKDFVKLRDALKQAHYDQLNDGDWEASLKALQKEYRAFVKKHGNILQNKAIERKAVVTDEETGETHEDVAITRRFDLRNKISDDPDYTLVEALEELNEETGEIKESKFLSERVLEKPEPPRIETPHDALLTTLNDIGHIDMPMIAERLGISEQEAIAALGSAVYESPSAGWQMADEYLSGNVKQKLKEAQEAVKSDRRFGRNIEALLSAQPSPVSPSDITASIGMNWIPAKVYEQFLEEKTGVKASVEFGEHTKQWTVTAISGWQTPVATVDWGTLDRNAADILDHALTGRPIRITRTEGRGADRKTVFDAAATEVANQKLAHLRDAFTEWLWQDGERADKLTRIYNDKFNTIVARKFDGRHLTLPGSSTAIKVFDHVKRGAWRIIQTGNTYLAHAVGSGKTWQMVISAMEQKRLGLIKKPMMVVPNHMLQQFAREWLQLYPAAQLMVADEKQFHTDNRRRFVSRVAMSDLDGVIITHSAFKLLDIDPEFKSGMIREQLDVMRAAMEEMGGEEGKSSRDPKIRDIQNRIEKMEQKLEAAMSSAGKDKNVRFDELGVDMLYVDEAHEFRKLAFTTQRQVKGIDSSGSDRAFDLWVKTRWLEQKNPGRSLVMASGTPVTNTLAELYSVQRFMAPKVLEDRGIEDFDSWAAMFGQENTEIEADASGRYSPVTRFTKFVNVPELTQMFREYADVLTSDHLAEMLGDKRPKVKGGSRELNITPMTDEYATYKDVLSSRLAESRAWKPSRDEPNNPDPIIKIIGDGRLAAIDMRFINPGLPSDPGSKLNRLIDGVIEVYKRTANNEYPGKDGKPEPDKGGAQMVFSDLGFGAGVTEHRGFNARAWFEKRLRDAGIPPGHVAFMSDYKKSTAKLKLFQDVNAGRVRILVGSSRNMGTGVNAQQRLVALHHLDTPWYPSDLEQREGRIVRQGNKNPSVEIYAYSTKGSYDTVMWQMLASKQRFIDQALSGDSSVRSIDDLTEASQFQIATAMTAGDPRAIQLAGIKADIDKLQRLFRAHEETRSRLRREYDLAKLFIESAESQLPNAEKLAGRVLDLSGDKFKAKADGKTFDKRKEWGEALLDILKRKVASGTDGRVAVGEISGFPVEFVGQIARDFDGKVKEYRSGLAVTLGDESIWLAHDHNDDAVGMSMRATNAVSALARRPAELRQRIEDNKAKRVALEPRLDAKFQFAQELADKIKEAGELEAAMVADQAKTEEPARDDSKLSRGTGSGMALRDLQAVVDRVTPHFKNLPRVHVLESPAGLSTKDPSQKALRDFIRKSDAWDDVEGATHDGEIYLFASGMTDEARAEHVLATHEVTHYGLRGAVGKELDAALQHVWMHNAKVRKAAAAIKRARGLRSNVEAVEEVLADMPSAELARLTGWRRVVKSIRDWLKRAGATKLAARLDAWINAGMTDAERADLFVAELVASAREWVKTGKGRAEMLGTRLADPSMADDMAEQEKWLEKEARARGYKSIDELAEKDYKVFENLAALWRKKHPVDVALMSRSVYAGKDGILDQTTAGETIDGAMLKELRRAAAGLESPRKGTFLTVTEDGRAIATGEPGTRIPETFIRFARVNGLKFSAQRIVHRTIGSVGNHVGDLTVTTGNKGIINPKSEPMPIEHRESGALYFGESGKSIDRTGKTRFSTSKLGAGKTAVPKQTAAQRAGAIINKPAGTPRPLDALLKGTTKAVGLLKLTSAAYDTAASILDRYTPEQIKAGMLSDYGIPEAVIDERSMMEGRQRHKVRGAGTLLEKLSTLTRAESRVAYAWMNNNDPQAADYFEKQLPEESTKVLKDVRTLIDQLSKEAIRLGQLNQEAYDRNKFAYLHRSYIKHTAELTKGEAKSRGRTISVLGDQYKGRGMTDAIDMSKVKNIAPEWWNRKLQAGKADKGLKGETFIRLERHAPSGEGTAALPGMGDKSKGKLLEVAYWPAGEPMPARLSTWDQSGTWEVRDTKGDKLIVWRDFTKQEREAMGEIDEARYAIAKTLHNMIHDIEVGKYMEWLGQNYAKKEGEPIDGKVVEASERLFDTFKQDEWVHVPDTKIPGTQVKKYGSLAGRYIPGPIWNDLRQMGTRIKPLGETYAALQRAWKISKTALSPSVHMNNVMANFVMADWHDVTAGHVLKALKLMTSKDAAASEVLNRFGDSGGTIGTWTVNELQKDQLRPLLEALEKELGVAGSISGQVGVMSALQLALKGRFPSAWDALKPSKTGQAPAKVARAMMDLYEAEDQVFRLAAWLKSKEDGATDAQAGKFARKSFLDYRINAPWVQMMRSTALPFIAFTYRAVPMMLETASKKPWKLMKLGLVVGAINALGYMLSGGDEDDERKLLPEEKAGRIWGIVPKLVRMPWNDANDSPVFLDIRRWIPVGDIFDTGATNAALPILPSMQPGGPLALMAEIALNKQGFTGKAITLETDTPAEKAQKFVDYLYKAFAPNIAVLPGTYAWTGIANAGSGRTDSFGREQSLAQSIISSVGIKVGSYPKDVLQLNARRAAQAKMMEIDRNITALKREYQKSGITADELQEKAAKQMAKKRKIVEELHGRMAGN